MEYAFSVAQINSLKENVQEYKFDNFKGLLIYLSKTILLYFGSICLAFL